MNGEPKESDWKIFRDSLPEVREKYLKKKNSEISKILNDPNRTETERFWAAEKRIKKETKILSECLDDYSRSSMGLKVMLMCRYGMLEREDLEKFSTELQGQFQGVWDKRNS